MERNNIQRLQIVAQGLGDLLNEVVFVGGAVAELYTPGAASEEIRISEDIDCIIEISTTKEYLHLEKLLESKGFQHDTTSGAPKCRWIFKHILTDIMPTMDTRILDFSNKWYALGFEKRTTYKLPNGTEIFIFPLAIYLASKLEAHNGRGGEDLRQSQDFEDIIFILDNNPDAGASIDSSPDPVKKYLREQFDILLAREDIVEGIESALPPNSDSDSVENILDILEFE